MNFRYTFNLFTGSAALLLVLTACSQDEIADGNRLPEGKYPLEITATGLQAPAASTPTTASRATVDNAWDGTETIALQVQGDAHTYIYSVTTSGGMTSENPYYWTSRDAITVSAWYPYAETMPDVVVKEDQSLRENYVASDFIAAEGQSVAFNTPASLKFTHRTSRITLHLQAGMGVEDVSGAEVSLMGLSTENGNPAVIRPYNTEGDTYDALLLPQTISADNTFLQIELNGNTHTARLANDTEMTAGYIHTYNVTVTNKGLKVEASSIIWENGGSETGIASIINSTYDEASNTYTVYTAKGLNDWAEAARADLSTNCILGADITLEIPTDGQSNWTTLGDYNNPYTGVFDGNSHTISNLTINNSTERQGLFGNIDQGGKVCNLTLANMNISGALRIGGIAGIVKETGTVLNCTVTGTLSGYSQSTYAGGITATNLGIIQGCRFSGTVRGVSYLGGIAGQNQGNYAHIIACSAEGSIEGSGTNNRINGGIVGGNSSSGSIIASLSRCMVSGAQKIGGVAGQNSLATITACYWDTFDGSGIGYGSGDVTKVDGVEITWSDAISTMNQAIESWNADNPDNSCPYRFRAGTDGVPEIQ